MNSEITIAEVDRRLVHLRDQQVLIDRDIAELYGVETKRINEAVKNNPDKFPPGYIITLEPAEIQQLVESFDRFENTPAEIADENFDRKSFSKMSRYAPKAFTEKALYMLATILKSPRATQTTLSIIESYAKARELARNIQAIHNEGDNDKQQNLIKRTGELLSDLLVDDTELAETESTIELNLMAIKFKHSVKRKKK